MSALHPRIWATLDPFLEPGAIWGRKVANEQFLTALFAQDPFDAYHFFLSTPRQIRDVAELFNRRFPCFADTGRVRFLPRHELPSALREQSYHCFHLSDCINHPAALARLRNIHATRIFPVTGMTHSLSYPDYPARFLAHLWPGCTPRDCIVATSRAGRSAVRNHFQQLRQNFDLDMDRFPQPQIEVIPLGMNAPPARTDREKMRQQGRKELNVLPDTCVMLALGRITPHSKMDLLPLLRAWQRIKSTVRHEVLLVVAGWVEPRDNFPGTFTALARNVGLPCSLVARPDERRKQELYAAADIFISLADNPQETFGLTLLEAGLFGLPVIAADYSGYRDIVVPGETGLLVPTWGPSDTQHIDMLAGLIPDYEVQFFLAQQTAVLVPALAEAMKTLIDRPQLRQSMGGQGGKRVRENYAWPSVIQKYIRLWDRLWEKPCDPGQHRTRPSPLELSYARVFASFPSGSYVPDTRVVRTKAGEKIQHSRDYPVIYAGLEEMISLEILGPMLFFARKPASLAEIILKTTALNPAPDEQSVLSCLYWAIKQDLLEIVAE